MRVCKCGRIERKRVKIYVLTWKTKKNHKNVVERWWVNGDYYQHFGKLVHKLFSCLARNFPILSSFHKDIGDMIDID